MDIEIQRGKLLSRIKRIEGQLRAVRGMIEAERDCCEVIQQMQAVSGAVKGTLSAMVKNDLYCCMARSESAGEYDRESIDKLLATIAKLV